MDRWVWTRQATKLLHRVAHSQRWCFRASPQRASASFPLNCTNVCVNSNEHWWTSCQTRGFVHDVQASGVGNDSRRQLQGGRSETSTQCQGRRNGDDSVTVSETPPQVAYNGLRTGNLKSKCGGALVTTNGVNAKEAVTAKLPWQDNVNAAVDVAWHTHHLSAHI